MNNYQLVKNTEWKEVEINGEDKDIPKDWDIGCLTDICEIKGGISAPKDFVKKEKDKTLPFFRVSNLSTRKKFLTDKETKEFLPLGKYKSFPKDSILIAKSGESIRQKYRSFLTEDSIVVGHIAILLAKYNKDYLYNLLMYFSPEDTLLKDSTMPALSTTELGKFQIYYPDLTQQSSIASILSAQESIISDIESLISKYESRFQYLSEELLSGKLRVKEVDGQTVLYKNPEDNWKEVEINGEMKEIPKDWEVEKLEVLIKENAKSKIKAGDLKKQGNFPAFNCSKDLKYFYSSSIVDNENIFLSTGGNAAIHYYNGKSAYSTDVYSITNKANVLTKFLYYTFKNGINIINEMFYGAGLKHLNKKEFKNSDWCLPNIKEQNNISSILFEQENLILQQKELLIKEKLKFDWLLDNLLSGKYLVEEENE